jgi:hypothetical protein
MDSFSFSEQVDLMHQIKALLSNFRTILKFNAFFENFNKQMRHLQDEMNMNIQFNGIVESSYESSKGRSGQGLLNEGLIITMFCVEFYLKKVVIMYKLAGRLVLDMLFEDDIADSLQN